MKCKFLKFNWFVILKVPLYSILSWYVMFTEEISAFYSHQPPDIIYSAKQQTQNAIHGGKMQFWNTVGALQIHGTL